MKIYNEIESNNEPILRYVAIKYKKILQSPISQYKLQNPLELESSLVS